MQLESKLPKHEQVEDIFNDKNGLISIVVREFLLDLDFTDCHDTPLFGMKIDRFLFKKDRKKLVITI